MCSVWLLVVNDLIFVLVTIKSQPLLSIMGWLFLKLNKKANRVVFKVIFFFTVNVTSKFFLVHFFKILNVIKCFGIEKGHMGKCIQSLCTYLIQIYF